MGWEPSVQRRVNIPIKEVTRCLTLQACRGLSFPLFRSYGAFLRLQNYVMVSNYAPCPAQCPHSDPWALRLCAGDYIEDLEIKRSPWIIQIGPM